MQSQDPGWPGRLQRALRRPRLWSRGGSSSRVARKPARNGPKERVVGLAEAATQRWLFIPDYEEMESKPESCQVHQEREGKEKPNVQSSSKDNYPDCGPCEWLGSGTAPGDECQRDGDAAQDGASGEISPQLTAFFTSALILASSVAVNSFSAKEVGHMAPSSRFAVSLKPNVAYLELNFCALWKKQTTLSSFYRPNSSSVPGW